MNKQLGSSSEQPYAALKEKLINLDVAAFTAIKIIKECVAECSEESTRRADEFKARYGDMIEAGKPGDMFPTEEHPRLLAHFYRMEELVNESKYTFDAAKAMADIRSEVNECSALILENKVTFEAIDPHFNVASNTFKQLFKESMALKEKSSGEGLLARIDKLKTYFQEVERALNEFEPLILGLVEIPDSHKSQHPSGKTGGAPASENSQPPVGVMIEMTEAYRPKYLH